MTTPRDPDALLAAYLADGMEVLPDRVVEAVLDEAHRTRQRAVFGPWRTRFMIKTVFGAAAVVAVLVLGGAAWLGAFRSGPITGAPSPLPSPIAIASPSPAPSPSPGPPEFPITRNALTIGTYRTTAFSQPMTFTMPEFVEEMGPDQQVTGFMYGNRHTIQIMYAPVEAAITIHDDFRINSNLCFPSEEVQEVPDGPEAVGEWLHGIEAADRNRNFTVTDQPDIIVDGRTAKVYDVVLGGVCGEDPVPGGPDVWFNAHEKHRIYAIPTGTDTILVFTWPNANPPELINPVADRLVQSFQFD